MKSLKTFCLVFFSVQALWANPKNTSPCEFLPLLAANPHYYIGPAEQNWAMENLPGNLAQRTLHHVHVLLRFTGTREEALRALVDGSYRTFRGRNFSRENALKLTRKRILPEKLAPFEKAIDLRIGTAEITGFLLRFAAHSDFETKAGRYLAMRRAGFSPVGSERWLEAKIPGETLNILIACGANPKQIQELLEFFQHEPGLVDRLEDYARLRHEHSHESVLALYAESEGWSHKKREKLNIR